MYSTCFRELDLDDNLIGELGGFEMMRALTKREQRTYIRLAVFSRVAILSVERKRVSEQTCR